MLESLAFQGQHGIFLRLCTIKMDCQTKSTGIVPFFVKLSSQCYIVLIPHMFWHYSNGRVLILSNLHSAVRWPPNGYDLEIGHF